jgi:hypothetical protein
MGHNATPQRLILTPIIDVCLSIRPKRFCVKMSHDTRQVLVTTNVPSLDFRKGLSLVAAQWLDGVSLVPLFVIIRPRVIVYRGRDPFILSMN